MCAKPNIERKRFKTGQHQSGTIVKFYFENEKIITAGYGISIRCSYDDKQQRKLQTFCRATYDILVTKYTSSQEAFYIR